MEQALSDEFLFFTGRRRSASEVLSGQVSGTRTGDMEVKRALDRLHELARGTCEALEAGELERCAELMNDQYEAKRGRAPGTVTPEMDSLRERALAAGALGVIPLGAGGGGFLLAYAPDPERTRSAMPAGIELPFGLDGGGCMRLQPAA